MKDRFAKSSKPAAYWDGTHHMVRDWGTNQPLPVYEGPCLVYLDIERAVFLHTFLQEGRRCWQSAEVSLTDVATSEMLAMGA